MKKRSLLIFPLVLLVFIYSCKKDEPIEPNVIVGQNEIATGTLELGTKISSDFTGQIIDEAGQPVSGVSISVGNKNASTDNSGFFYIEGADVHSKLAYLKAEKLGYFLGSRSLIPNPGSLNNVKIMLLSKNVAGTVNSGESSTVLLNSGGAVELNGEYVDVNGNSYNGQVDVSLKYLPALAPETSDQMPGMLYAENESGESGVLVTFGMLAVELIGDSGQELNIASGSIATIHVPVETAQLQSAPQTIPLWHFDEVAGYWVEEGQAELINGEYVGEVGHFSFWNCDRFLEDCKFYGTVSNQNADGVPYANISIDAGGNSTTGITNPDGSFFTYLPANTSIDMTVDHNCNTVPSSAFNFGPYAVSSENTETLNLNTSSLNSYNIVGTVVDCNNDPVTNGYVVLDAGGGYTFEPIVNGNVNFFLETCQTIQNVDMTATSPTGFSSNMQISVSGNVVNIGQVEICNGSTNQGLISSSPEYFQYILDNGPAQLFETDVQFLYADTVSDIGFGVGILELPDIIIGSDIVNTTGAYQAGPQTQTGTVWFTDMLNMDFNQPYFFYTSITEYGGSGGDMILSLTGFYLDNSSNSHDIQIYLKVNIP